MALEKGKSDGPDRRVSFPASRFLNDSVQVASFIAFVIENIGYLEMIIRRVTESIGREFSLKNTLNISDHTFNKAQQFIKTGEDGPFERFLEYLPLQMELVFCRFIDNFLTYISELLALIFTLQPDMLKSDEKISFKTVVECPTREELIGAVTEQKVIALSFKGMRELRDELEKNYKFQLFETEEDFERVAILIEKRNLLAHNRGYVNRRYLQRVKNAKEAFGERLMVSGPEVSEMMHFVKSLVEKIDQRAADKFGIPLDQPRPRRKLP